MSDEKSKPTLGQSEVQLLAARYSRNFGGLRRLTIKARPAICPFEDIIDHVPEGASILDLGCGPGFLLYAAAKSRLASRVVGIEANEPLIKEARSALASELGSNCVELFHAKAVADWTDEQFDVVTLIDVLHHIPKHSQIDFLIGALARVKTGGRLIYKDMRSDNPFFAIANRMHDLILARQWINYRPLGEIIELLTEHGFAVSNPTYRNTYWYAHEMIICQKE